MTAPVAIRRPPPHFFGINRSALWELSASNDTDAPLADLYVCWRCANHNIVVFPVNSEPPEWHDYPNGCGWGPLQYSGQLFRFNRLEWSRTYDEMPPKTVQHPRNDTQLQLFAG